MTADDQPLPREPDEGYRGYQRVGLALGPLASALVLKHIGAVMVSKADRRVVLSF